MVDPYAVLATMLSAQSLTDKADSFQQVNAWRIARFHVGSNTMHVQFRKYDVG